jgi:hypothetical protein
MRIVDKRLPNTTVSLARPHLDVLAEWEAMVARNEAKLKGDYIVLNGLRAYAWLMALPDTEANRNLPDIRLAHVVRH